MPSIAWTIRRCAVELTGKKFGQALDDAQDDRQQIVPHPTMSSPPSTPMTLPVIQAMSGWERTTMARATSSVVVSRPDGLRRRASLSSFA